MGEQCALCHYPGNAGCEWCATELLLLAAKSAHGRCRLIHSGRSSLYTRLAAAWVSVLVVDGANPSARPPSRFDHERRCADVRHYCSPTETSGQGGAMHQAPPSPPRVCLPRLLTLLSLPVTSCVPACRLLNKRAIGLGGKCTGDTTPLQYRS